MSTDANVLSHYKLKFAINYPSIEECWTEGYEDCQQNREETDNPYPENTTANQHWSDGWWGAYFDEEPLFDVDGVHPKAQVDNVIPIDQSKLSNKKLAKRFLQITGAGLFALLCYELAELAA